jgi:hypothetical protein
MLPYPLRYGLFGLLRKSLPVRLDEGVETGRKQVHCGERLLVDAPRSSDIAVTRLARFAGGTERAPIDDYGWNRGKRRSQSQA